MRLAGVDFDADGNPGAVSNAGSVLTQKAGWTVGAGLEGRLFGGIVGNSLHQSGIPTRTVLMPNSVTII